MPIPPFIPSPVTGDAFIGRQPLVRNLRARIVQGESLAVIGGPKLGRTSLVQTALRGLAGRTVHQPVHQIDVGADPASRMDLLPGSIVILDNTDRVADAAIASLLAWTSSAKPASIVITGGRRLHAMISHTETLGLRPFRTFPLSVLLDGEIRQLIGRNTRADLTAWTGNHPYLTRLLLHYLHGEGDENPRTVEEAVVAGQCQWEPFVERLAAESSEGPEWRLLRYLIEYGKPVNPSLAQSDTGIQNIKQVADTLTYLGVIGRWIRNEEATLFAGCRLLNDFITAHANGASPPA